MTTVSNPAAPSESYLETESVRLLYQHAWLMSLLVGVAATTLTGYMFYGYVDTSLIAFWLLFINGIIVARVGLIIVFARARPAEDQYAKWGRYYLAAAWLNGFAWGLPALVLDNQQLTLVFFYTLVIGGFVAGAIPGLSFNIRAFYGFALFSSVPLIVRLFFWREEFFEILGVLSVLFVMINTASAKISNRRIKQQIRLEYENRRLVENLKTEKERAERANEVKTRFLAAASHDLRQPLHAMGLFVDALDARIKFPEVRKIMDNLKLSTDSLNSLLNSLLDISKLDAGTLKPDVSDIDLSALLDQLALEFAPQALSKGLKLRIRPSDAWVRSDPVMLARILRNLLTNAIRYTSAGGVLVGCRRRNGDVRIEVHDTGAGIPANEIEHVFEEFYQLENPERDRDKGLGLGLSIVKRLADLLRHELDVRSRAGKGSVFAVTVPAAHAAPQRENRVRTYRDDLAGAVIVVIDDEAPIRKGMNDALQSWGCRSVLAESAEDALQQLTTAGLVPDLIVADYRLREGKTGVEAIKRIHAHAGQEIPAIVVTGDSAPERLLETKESGYRLLHKPVSAASLRSLAGYLIEKAKAPNRADS
jgi:signal transduction histidine kinase